MPLTQQHLRHAVALFITHIPEERKSKLPFENRSPGYRWTRKFRKRVDSLFKFPKPDRPESKRFVVVKSETVTTRYVALEKLVEQRIWNLDETGSTAGRDSTENTSSRRFMRRGGSGDIRLPDFINCSRITELAFVSGDGDEAPTLFVYKGSCLPFSRVVVNGVKEVQTYSTFLPANAVVTVREALGGVDTLNFITGLFVSFNAYDI